MLTFFIGLLTALMFLTCVALILLVLVQLPKKESGAGLAFGGAATDALFGAGRGNALTKMTKYVAGAFFVLTLVVAVLTTRQARYGSDLLQDELRRQSAAPAPLALPGDPSPVRPQTPPPAPPAPAEPQN
jgi:preprotein translocase subunit SecG